MEAFDESVADVPGAGLVAGGDTAVCAMAALDRTAVRNAVLPISLTEAVLGARIKVPTPTGAVTMAIPKGSNTGTMLRLRGKGAPKHAGGHGDQFVKLKVILPKEPNPELEAFVSSWEIGKTYNPREELTP
jgi:DnaJ-class molecular chaperone